MGILEEFKVITHSNHEYHSLGVILHDYKGFVLVSILSLKT